MLSAKLTMYRSFLLACLLFSVLAIQAQENSPFSRYGLGDLYPQQTIAGRAMGSISAAFTSSQAINTLNPASYGNIGLVTYDIGISIDQRTLQSANPAATYSSANFLPSYVLIGSPISAAKKIGIVFGFKPTARINYSVENVTRTSVDSLQTLYQGTGGLNQAIIGIGKRWGSDSSRVNISIGFNTGYEFGRKQISTIINYINDTLAFNKSDFSTTTSYGGLFFNPGIMVSFLLGTEVNKLTKLKEQYLLRLGASGTFQHNLNANQNYIAESFNYDANGAIVPIDTIKLQNDISGKIIVPVTYNAGFMLAKYMPIFGVNKWAVSMDYSAGKWSSYRFYGQPDQVVNSWMVHAGAEVTPDPSSNGLFNRSTFRAGFYTGTDYINADGNGYKVTAFTLGFGFNLRKFRTSYNNQFTLINTAIEFGKRGTGVNNITENFLKFSLGLSLSDIWFIKHKYD